jgi:hypothetical protein
MMKLTALLLIVALCSPLMAATVPVRFPEGLTRGYLVLRDVQGKLLAHGDLIQVIQGDALDKRMVFRFEDGSLYDERVTFSQGEVFRLRTYRLTQKGPSFETDTEISLTAATGAYRVTTKDHKDGEQKTHEGTTEIPPDLYNGLVTTIVKDFPKGRGEIVHYAAFMPEPKIIELEMTPAGDVDIVAGDRKDKAVHYLLKPKLGLLTTFFAKLVNRTPPDLHVWIAGDGAPAFVAFEGPLAANGPIWRIEVVSPQLAR